VAGVATYGCIYALTAMGLVVTYATSGVFNFAQGAIGMMAGFGFWQLSVHFHWPTWAAFIVVVLIATPLAGAAIERVLIRRLEGAGLDATLTVTIGLLLLLIAIASIAWNPADGRTLPQFFNGHQITVGGVVLTWHQLIIVIVAVVAALVLRVFLYRTRPGIAMRAVVDDRELTALSGATPARYAQLGWALGAMLAAISGVLIAPLVNLDINTLTLLVINGYAAAMVGRLRNLPLTFLGGIILGLLQSYAIGYLPISLVTQLEQLLPMAFLLVVILVIPQTRAPMARTIKLRAPRVAGLRESLLVGAGFLVAAFVLSRFLSSGNLATAGEGMAFAIIMLSLVLLTGYGGQVSLCQLTFAGLGAYAMSEVGGADGSLLGIVAAIGLSAAVGTVVALPALRLRGLYLALTTLAFAVAMDDAFFSNTSIFGVQLSKVVARPHIPWISMADKGSYLLLLAVVYAILAVGVLAFRRSRYGRRLLAVSDSPAACLTLGIGMVRPKLAVFTLSAGIAGLGGALYGGSVAAIDDSNFQFLLSLTILLIAVAWGIRTVAGMLFGGVILALSPILESHVSTPRDVFSLFVGLAAIGVSQNPEGTFGGNTFLQRQRERKQAAVANAATDGRTPVERSMGRAAS
jgi:branched-chain amino acid transport system permease protein